VPALVGVERADAHEAVHAALGLAVAVGVLALDEHGGLADAGLVAGLHVLHLDGEAAALGPAVVHAEKHVGPVVRLGAARARLDGEDGVVLVELAGEEGGDLELVELGDHRGDLSVELLRVGSFSAPSAASMSSTITSTSPSFLWKSRRRGGRPLSGR
jgi:hypothetical protein